MWCSWDSMAWELKVGSARRVGEDVAVAHDASAWGGPRTSQDGTWPSVTSQMWRTQLAYIATERRE